MGSARGLASAWLAAVTVACTDPAPGAADAGRAADTAAAVEDSGAAPESDGSPDAGTGTCPAPRLQLGTTRQSKATPEAFVPTLPESEIDVLRGPQALWMVVVAFRTCGLYTAPLKLEARVATDDGASSGKADLKNQKLLPGGDGMSYYYNLWLVVQNPTLSDGKKGELTMTVTDAKGVTGTHVVRVTFHLARPCMTTTDCAEPGAPAALVCLDGSCNKR